MLIEHNEEKFASFNQVVFNQNLMQYKGMTTKYRAFEQPNLPNNIILSVLKKLSPQNHLQVPTFEQFWVWIKNKHGTELSMMLAHFFSPGDEEEAAYLKNQMRNKTEHQYWKHIKARIYKQWCSIVTEMQCVYAIVEAVQQKGYQWRVLSSAQLDCAGVDFILVIDNEECKVYPFQIKKDSRSVYVQKKHNTKDNFEQVEIKKKQQKAIELELSQLKLKGIIQNLTILKYALPKNNKLTYDYLAMSENGFVYYDGLKLVESINSQLQ